MKVGIEVVTGFLGAGKSAFINSLINKTKAFGEKIIVLTCESGNVNIKELEENNISVKYIDFIDDNSGLNEEIYRVVNEHKPHRIIIEYNGTETLEHLYRCIFDNETGKLIKLDTIYFICDGSNLDFYIKNMGELLLPFIQSSDVLVINNCERLSEDKISEGEDILVTLNHKAQIIKSKNNDDFEKALEESKLLENIFLRNMKVKIIDYMRK